MKRLWTVALMLALVLTLAVSVPAFAQESATDDDTATPPVTCPNFVDEDEDGVCDYFQQNMGHGRGMGMGMWGHGQNFVDEDGDGICDNCPAEQGYGRGRMGRMGQFGNTDDTGRSGWMGRMGGMFQRFGGRGWHR